MASRGVNKVLLIGRLGQDPDVRFTKSGSPVTNITVATSEHWKDKQTNERQERTEWHKVVFFNRLAEIAGEYLKKGSLIHLEGSLRTRDYEKEGQKHYVTEIVAQEMQMLDQRGDTMDSSASISTATNQSASKADPAPIEDDDIPF